MFVGERSWNREPFELRQLRPVDRTVDHDNVAQIHGRHQRLGIDIRIDACAERFFISAQPGNEHAGAMETVCGIERHQLPP
jgi:hypothetical protein